MKTSSGCIGCVTGEKASQTVNLILEKNLDEMRALVNVLNQNVEGNYIITKNWKTNWKIFSNKKDAP